MKAIKRLLLALAVVCGAAVPASAQYYQLANQVTDMLQTAIRGGVNYRGFVDVAYLNGIGDKQANFVSLTTTQGVKYQDWFFMGVGAGVDFMNTKTNDGGYVPSASSGKRTTTSAVMVPLYTDFRFNIGSPAATGFFIDVKVGAGFYVADKYILVGDGYVNSRESFLLRPSVGLRVPVSKSNPKYALNIGASYQLLTNSYWYNPSGSNSITLSSLGLGVSFEW